MGRYQGSTNKWSLLGWGNLLNIALSDPVWHSRAPEGWGPQLWRSFWSFPRATDLDKAVPVLGVWHWRNRAIISKQRIEEQSKKRPDTTKCHDNKDGWWGGEWLGPRHIKASGGSSEEGPFNTRLEWQETGSQAKITFWTHGQDGQNKNKHNVKLLNIKKKSSLALKQAVSFRWLK